MKIKTNPSFRNSLARVVGLVTLATLALSASNLLMAAEDSALFWSISRQGEPVGFLLGTIHSEDPRVVDFSVEFIDQMTSNQVYAMEMVPDLPTLRQLTEFMNYQDGSTLEGHIGAERFRRVQAALAEYKLPEGWVVKMKVWAAMITLSVPPPETGFFMDFSLSLRAAGAGLRVAGLETMDEQLSFLEQMPMEQQLMLLDEALKESDKVREIHRQMVDSYLEGDLTALSALSDEQMSTLEPEAKAYFMEQGIDIRNYGMLDSLVSLLQENRVFAAVGALHLPGPSGLIQLLREQGYALTPLPMPFIDAAQESGQQSPQ